jgi:hypothetical protein
MNFKLHNHKQNISNMSNNMNINIKATEDIFEEENLFSIPKI